MNLSLRTFVFAALCIFSGGLLQAQQKGEPGAFDFYLLNVVPAAEFCRIADVGAHCVQPHTAFALHGLWAQRFNGTYPVFCGERAGPKRPAHNLDLTPDLMLLDHEWKKHGTCTTLAPEVFFESERRAFRSFRVPAKLSTATHDITLAPTDFLALFAKANPQFPPSSVILWCSEHRVTSVSACFSRDLKPMVCQGLKSCGDEAVTLVAPQPQHRVN